METFLPVIFGIAITEMIISGTWQPFYFILGLPLYRKSTALSLPPNVSTEELNKVFKKGWTDPILFKKISTNQIAFRESFFSFRLFTYTPVMHGLIQYNNGELKIIGLANWFALVFIAFFIAMGSGIAERLEFDLIFTLFPIGLFAFLYFIQVKRYNRIYDILSGQSAV